MENETINDKKKFRNLDDYNNKDISEKIMIRKLKLESNKLRKGVDTN